MLDPNRKDFKLLDEAFNLNPNEKALLSSIVKLEWFELLQRIMEDCVRSYARRLMSTPANDTTSIIANHNQATAVHEFYRAFIDRIDVECNIAAHFNSTVGTIGNPERPDYIIEDKVQLGIKP